MKQDYLIRQADLIPLEVLKTPITLVGAGAIGSFTTLALAKMGFSRLKVWDFDTVDAANMNSQFYPIDSIGQQKVFALQNMVKRFTGTEITAINQKHLEHMAITDKICVSAVDSMTVRSQLFDSFFGQWFVDPRMGAEDAALYVCDTKQPTEKDDYKTTLYSDDKAVQEKCTAKATMYTACMLSGLVSKAIKDVLTSNEYPINAFWSIGGHEFVANKGAINE
jgi:hypothetical protein